MWWSWVLTAVGVLGLYFIGKKSKIGWYIGIAAQGLWILYAIFTQQWGFVVSAIAYGWVYLGGLMNYEDRKTKEEKDGNPQ